MSALEGVIGALEIGPRGMKFSNSLRVLREGFGLGPAADRKGVPPVPHWETLAGQAVDLVGGLFDELQKLLASDAPLAEIEAVRKQIEELGDEVRVAGLVVGMMNPWRPARVAAAVRLGPAKQVKTRFPWLAEALKWLAGKKVVKASDFSSLSMDEQQQAFTAPGIENTKELRRIRDELAEGQQTGESWPEFRKRVGDSIALTRAQTETVYRTNVHQGFVTGFKKAMASKGVSDEFPYVMFSATEDSRVRELHWDLDGFVCATSDPAWKVLQRALADWGCRCNPIPLTAEQAVSLGIKTFKDLPADVVKKYGKGISAKGAPDPVFVSHPSQRIRPRAFQTVLADADKLDSVWSRDEQSYLPAGGVGVTETPGKRENFREFLKSGEPIEQPKVVIADSGLLSFDDGRSRTRVLIDAGLKQIPLTVPNSDVNKVRKLVGAK